MFSEKLSPNTIPKRVVIIGSNGFVGGHVCDLFKITC